MGELQGQSNMILEFFLNIRSFKKIALKHLMTLNGGIHFEAIKTCFRVFSLLSV